MRQKTTDERRGALSAAALLFVHCAFSLFAVTAAWLFFKLGFSFSQCGFYATTGYTCITCGATRSVGALLNFQLLRSFLLNPIPLLLAALMLYTLVFELVAAVKKSNARIRYAWVYPVIIVLTAFVYNILRMLGAAPLPGTV